MAIVQRRVGPIFGVLLALLAVAAVRTADLGLLHSGTLSRVGRDQQVTDQTLPAPRGTITDRNGIDLAISEPADEVSATPYLVTDPQLHTDPLYDAQRLAPLLGVPQSKVLAELSERSGFVYLAHALSVERARAVLDLGLPGISASPVMHRVYPRGGLAGQVLGTVSSAPGTEGAGLAGLEYSENSLLNGHAGERRVVSDAKGEPISIASVHAEVPGTPISLTLDANIQRRSEEVLEAVGKVFHPKDATAIVMNPNTGSILAMANWPQMNPNDPTQASEEALENRAVSFDYEPGSTFKVVAVSAGLQDKLITPQTEFNIPDEIQVANRTIHDDAPHPEETLSTEQILAQSSNVGAIKIGELDGSSRFNEWIHRYGFGASTGVDLPGEEIGLVPPLDDWSGSSIGNLPIGQGEAVTPIQMATAYSAIANGGILRPPHIVGMIGSRPVAEPSGHRVISTETAAQLRHMLEGVLAPGGTASEVSIPGYQLAGKTGTANKIDPATGEYSQTAYVASFVGFAPANDPKLLCAVIIDEPQAGSIYGGVVAAPAFGQIMAFSMPYLGITPSK